MSGAFCQSLDHEREGPVLCRWGGPLNKRTRSARGQVFAARIFSSSGSFRLFCRSWDTALHLELDLTMTVSANLHPFVVPLSGNLSVDRLQQY